MCADLVFDLFIMFDKTQNVYTVLCSFSFIALWPRALQIPFITKNTNQSEIWGPLTASIGHVLHCGFAKGVSKYYKALM